MLVWLNTSTQKMCIRSNKTSPFSVTTMAQFVSCLQCAQHIQDVWHQERQRKKKKNMWKMPYFCILADSSLVWAFSWGAKTVSDISSGFVLHYKGWVCSITSWKCDHAHFLICKPDCVSLFSLSHNNTHRQYGDGRIKHGCMQMRHVCENKCVCAEKIWRCQKFKVICYFFVCMYFMCA